ncbi:MAG: NUDIX hydrolase [bacterium]|nr:NUDIX hydrolase [bacterium]
MAWLGLRVFFFIFRPRLRASIVLVRWNGRLLLVTNSYRAGSGFPGGMLKWREDPQKGARRELEEEVGLSVGPEALPLFEVFPQEKWCARIELHVFALDLEREPTLEIDRREVIEAGFCTLAEASHQLPELRELLERFAAAIPGRLVGSPDEESEAPG